MEGWAKELAEKASPKLQVIIAGNKVDLIYDRVIHAQVAAVWAQSHNAKWYTEVSAKYGSGISRLFEKAAELAANARRSCARVTIENDSLTSRLDAGARQGCC
jgi:GTPase SAR1 family protein